MYWSNVGGGEHAYTKMWGKTLARTPDGSQIGSQIYDICLFLVTYGECAEQLGLNAVKNFNALRFQLSVTFFDHRRNQIVTIAGTPWQSLESLEFVFGITSIQGETRYAGDAGHIIKMAIHTITRDVSGANQ